MSAFSLTSQLLQSSSLTCPKFRRLVSQDCVEKEGEGSPGSLVVLDSPWNSGHKCTAWMGSPGHSQEGGNPHSHDRCMYLAEMVV